MTASLAEREARSFVATADSSTDIFFPQLPPELS
jgi:hypothetical protein